MAKLSEEYGRRDLFRHCRNSRKATGGNNFFANSSGISAARAGIDQTGCTRSPPAGVIFFPTLVPGSGNFQLSRLAGLGYGLGLGFWVVITIIVSLTLTLITTLTVILP